MISTPLPVMTPVAVATITSGSIFNPLKGGAAGISYQVKVDALVKIIVYNRNGKLIKTLVSSQKEAGIYTASWNGTFTDGKTVSAGIYVIYVSIGGVETKLKVAVKK